MVKKNLARTAVGWGDIGGYQLLLLTDFLSQGTPFSEGENP
jgi:hypothetical protein